MTGKVERRKPIGSRLNRWLFSGIGSRLILVILFLHMLLIGITQLVVPLYSQSLGVSQVALGVITGAFGMAGVLLSVLNGVLHNQ